MIRNAYSRSDAITAILLDIEMKRNPYSQKQEEGKGDNSKEETGVGVDGDWRGGGGGAANRKLFSNMSSNKRLVAL